MICRCCTYRRGSANDCGAYNRGRSSPSNSDYIIIECISDDTRTPPSAGEEDGSSAFDFGFVCAGLLSQALFQM